MQHLQWFPGHMTSAIRMMEENLKLVDGVLVVLDSRAPRASLNENLDNLFLNKKVLYVLNKSDLIEKSDTNRIISEFVKEGKEVVAVSAMDKRAVDLLYDKIFYLLKDKVERNKLKGIFIPLRIMVAGVPNTGKSTIINALVGGKKAITGNKAGVTKGKQWIRIKDLELLDTPGTMPPSFKDQVKAMYLAFVGSMNDVNLDLEDLAFEFIKILAEKYPEKLKTKYDVKDVTASTIEVMEEICERRGFIKKGKEYDYERCAVAVIDDFRKGRIGKICFE